MGDRAETRARRTYARCRSMRAFYVGRGAPMAIATASKTTWMTTGGGGDDDGNGDDGNDDGRGGKRSRDGKTSARSVRRSRASETTTEMVTYACATSEGGTALARRETTRGAAATTSRSREIARDEGDGEAMTAIVMDASAKRVFCASRSGRVVRMDVVEREDGTTTTRRVKAWSPHKSSPVLDMCVDGTGTLLCTGSADRSARVWDIERGYCTHAFRGRHGGAVTATAFHPNPRAARAFTAAEDGSVAMWSLVGAETGGGKKGKKGVAADGCVKFIEDAHVSAVTAIRIDAESNTLLTAGRDKVVRAYDLDTLTPRSTTAVHETIEDCVILRASSAIVRDGRVKPPPNPAGVIFAVVGDSGRIRVWREGTAKHALESAPLVAEKTLTKGGDEEEDEFEAAASTFTKCALTHSGDGIIGVSGDARILTYVVNAETGAFEIENEIVANTDEIIGLSFVPDASEEAAMNVEGDDEDPDEARTLARMPREMAVVTNSPTVRMFDPSTMSCVGSLSGHSAVVLCVDAALASDGTALIITGAKDHAVRLWDAASRSCLAVGEGHVGAVAAVAFPPNSSKGVTFAVSGGSDRVLRVWDVEGARKSADGEMSATAATVAHDKSLNGVAVAPHLRMVATCSSDKTAKIWKMPDLVPLATLRGHRRGVWACAFSPSDRVLATAGGDKTVKIWSVDDRAGSDSNGACLRTLEGHTASVLSISFLSRGTQLLTTGGDGLLNLWNVTAGACVVSVDAHEDKAWALAVASDGDWVATGGTDASMSLWQDSTSSSTAETAQKHALAVEREQAFFNAERSGEVAKAIELALSLERPGALLRVLTRMLEDDYEHGDARLRQCVKPLSDESLTRMLKCVREWNTNGRTCHVAQHVLAAIFRTHSMEELSKLEDIGGIMQACRAYTERHRSRLERLYRGTFMVDILLSRTGAIVDDEETEEELRKSRETIDDFGFMRADGAAPPPRLLAPAAPQLAAVSEEEEEDDGEEPADDVSDEAMDEEDEEEEEEDEDKDEDEDKSEEEPLAKEDVKEEDVAMGPPKKLKRLSILKRVASDVEKQQKLLRDPSPRHTRSGKKLGFK